MRRTRFDEILHATCVRTPNQDLHFHSDLASTFQDLSNGTLVASIGQELRKLDFRDMHRVWLGIGLLGVLTFSGEWVEPKLEGNMLHPHAWSMSTTPPHFPLLSVLLRSLLVQVMSRYLKTMYHPSFKHVSLISTPSSKPFAAFISEDIRLRPTRPFKTFTTLTNP